MPAGTRLITKEHETSQSPLEATLTFGALSAPLTHVRPATQPTEQTTIWRCPGAGSSASKTTLNRPPGTLEIDPFPAIGREQMQFFARGNRPDSLADGRPD